MGSSRMNKSKKILMFVRMGPRECVELRTRALGLARLDRPSIRNRGTMEERCQAEYWDVVINTSIYKTSIATLVDPRAAM